MLRRESFLLVLVVFLVSFVGLGDRMIWNPVEGRYMGIAVEMVQDGHWIVPHYNGQIYDQKPPLFFWMMAGFLSLKPDQPSEFLARTPSAIGALLLVFGILQLGRRLFPGRAGFYGAICAATTYLIFWSSRFAHMDTLMSAAMVWLVVAWIDLGLGTSSRRLVSAWTAIGALFSGMMFKGPMVLLFPVVGLSYAVIRTREHRFWRQSLLFPVVLSALALVALWFFPAWRHAGDEWAMELVVREGLGRLANDAEDPKHNRLYYLWNFWLLSAPWGFLLPVAWRFKTGLVSSREQFGHYLIQGWLFGGFAVLMTGAAPQGRYLMPLFVPAFLWIGRLLDQVFSSGDGAAHRFTQTVLRSTTVLFGALFFGLGFLFAASIFGHYVPISKSLDGLFQALGRSGGPTLVASLVLLACASAGWVISWRGRLMELFCSQILMMMAAALIWGLVLAPAFDEVRGNHHLLGVVRPLVVEGREIVIPGQHGIRESTAGFYRFYLGQPIHRPKWDGFDLIQNVNQQPVVVLVRESELVHLPELLPKGYFRLQDSGIGTPPVIVAVNPRPAGQ